MKLNFRSLAILSALVFFSLALTWMFAPNAMLSRWDVDFSHSVGLIARRGAALYAGIGVMLFSARNAESSPARSALVIHTVFAYYSTDGRRRTSLHNSDKTVRTNLLRLQGSLPPPMIRARQCREVGRNNSQSVLSC